MVGHGVKIRLTDAFVKVKLTPTWEVDMPEWAVVVSLLAAVLIGFVLGRASRGGHNWWQEMTIGNNEVRNEGLKVLADRYALGEIDDEEFRVRAAELKQANAGAWRSI
jgi:uncharacterized membrane protein